MLIGCAFVLMATFVSQPPPAIEAELARTNETRGVFVQTKKLPSGEEFVSKGEFVIRPGKDFEWRVTEPFDSLFFADREKYIYSNEDECVEKPLDGLPGFSRFIAVEQGDFSDFFRTFDCLYKEDDADEGGAFHVLAKPKDPKLKRVLSRVEADGTIPSWTIKATFPDGTIFCIKFDTPLTRRAEN